MVNSLWGELCTKPIQQPGLDEHIIGDQQIRMVLKCTFTQQIPVDSDLPLYLIIVRVLIFGEIGGRLLVQI